MIAVQGGSGYPEPPCTDSNSIMRVDDTVYLDEAVRRSSIVSEDFQVVVEGRACNHRTQILKNPVYLPSFLLSSSTGMNPVIKGTYL